MTIVNKKLYIYIESGEGQGNVCHDKGKKIYYQTQFMFQCDKTTKFKADYVTQSDYDTCIYEVHIRTGYACPGYTPAPGPASSSSTSSFSMGYVAIICFFSAIILGLLIYYIVLGATSKNWGKESLAPPLNLCKYFWIYTCVGCKVTYEFAKNKMSKDGDSGGIDDDVLIDTDE